MLETQRKTFIATAELVLIFELFTFLFQFAWEILQSPFYGRMAAMSHWEGTLIPIPINPAQLRAI